MKGIGFDRINGPAGHDFAEDNPKQPQSKAAQRQNHQNTPGRQPCQARQMAIHGVAVPEQHTVQKQRHGCYQHHAEA